MFMVYQVGISLLVVRNGRLMRMLWGSTRRNIGKFMKKIRLIVRKIMGIEEYPFP